MSKSTITYADNMTEFEEKFIQSFREQFHIKYQQKSFSLPDEQISSVVQCMLQLLPHQHPYEALIGPFYSGRGVQRVMNISRQAIAKRAKKNDIISCPLGNGKPVYPVWQFTEENSLNVNILTVYKILRENCDEWTAILWLSSPWPEDENVLIRDMLCTGENIVDILTYARDTSFHWSE